MALSKKQHVDGWFKIAANPMGFYFCNFPYDKMKILLSNFPKKIENIKLNNKPAGSKDYISEALTWLTIYNETGTSLICATYRCMSFIGGFRRITKALLYVTFPK